MIGGVDVRIPSNIGSVWIEAAVRVVLRDWPNAVFENAETAERFETIAPIPFSEMRELFIYRDSQSADIWDRLGAVESAENSMIHLIQDEGQLTVVIDRPSPEIEAILASIRSELANQHLHAVPTRAAADN